ncbi:MAG TPA: hypothetical protein VKT51_06620 [Candidatus Eremiobacteraceae bacterium]|nr:hypothetical protein [Candidatus Eremiobacteraceae bacterium]
MTDAEQDGREASRAAGLLYVNDRKPGIRRLRRGRGFGYIAPDGSAVRESAELARIRALAIPPAYRDVWICPSPRGHIQASARDDRGRKQYKYHAEWTLVRDAAKFDRMLSFAKSLPALRKRVARDLRKRGLGKERVVAAVVRLLEDTLIRVGNEEYARANKSFGLTTLRTKHVVAKSDTLHFRFRGKSGRFHEISVADSRLAAIVRRCAELPGQELFQYEDETGTAVPIESQDVNDYLRSATAAEFSAKDVRTWHATVLCLDILRRCESAPDANDARRIQAAAVEHVAKILGNTAAVCRKCYIHPLVFSWHEDGSIARRVRTPRRALSGLSAIETAAIRAFQRAA